MESHIRLLGILHIIWSCLSVLAGIVVLLVMGSIGAFAALAGQSDQDAAVALPVMAIIGLVICVVLIAFALPGLFCGFGLLNRRSWARPLGIVLSALDLLSVPFGTALGIYGLWVLLNDQTRALFSAYR